MTYTPPIRDILFNLEVVGFRGLSGVPYFAEVDEPTVRAVLDAAGELARDVFAPLNRSGDIQSARFENGRVVAPDGFAKAYRSFVEGSWGALSADAEFGGQALPKTLESAVYEMIHGANMAFGLCPMLTRGAIEALTVHGTEQQKNLYLEKLIKGEWTGTMNLTEVQSGSDLGAVLTRAEPDGDGLYRLTGQKIFITWGDHDMAENIIHLVLARLPDSPGGSRGLSMFLVPKRMVLDDGSLGVANEVGPIGIEHKLGIRGSATCIMEFRGAKAELIGKVNDGLPQMFTMMNAARLQVGLEGVGIAERAYQKAYAYSLERRQGRSVWTGEQSAPIFDHPDIRRMLMLMKAKIVAARAICFATALAGDLSEHAQSADQKAAAKRRQEILTPIAKAWSTDVGVEVASIALQVHGGAGFIEETGIAQCYRDARIAPIYEGTNGIQAMDLMGRKLAMADGKAAAELLDEIASTAAQLNKAPNAQLHGIGASLGRALEAARAATAWLIEHRGQQSDALAGAYPYMTLMGDLIGGAMLAKGALLAAERMAGETDHDKWWQTRIGLAEVFADQVLSHAQGLSQAAMAGSKSLTNTSERALSPN